MIDQGIPPHPNCTGEEMALHHMLKFAEDDDVDEDDEEDMEDMDCEVLPRLPITR